jgi:predicted alpha/beta-hydrolase family hydrolase
MATVTSLAIRGYRAEPVPNRFLAAGGTSGQLAVLLPGLGYTLDMPLFYYAEHLLLKQGWDVLRVEYAYHRHPEFGTLPQAEQRQWLLEDATAAFRIGVARQPYGHVALVGKSLGTLAMGHLLTLPDRPDAAMRAVWLTPLLGVERLREQITRYGGPSLFVIGTADPHYDPAILDALQAATAGDAVVIVNADHGMDIPGDPAASVRGLEQVVAAMTRFIG